MNALQAFLLVLLTLLAGVAVAVPLGELEKYLGDALVVQIAEVEVERNQALVEQRKAEHGLKVYGNTGVIHSFEIVDVGRTRSFEALSAQLGLRYPLFGSLLREKLAILGAQADVAVSTARRELAKGQVLLVLRRRYIDYWAQQKTIGLSKAFLELEDTARKVFGQRRDAGLLLEADRREFLTAFALARRNLANANAAGGDDLSAINLITNRNSEGFIAAYPELPAPCLQREELSRVVEQYHPELAALRAITYAKGDRLNFERSMPIESGVNVAQTALYDLSATETGYSTMIGLDFRMPLDFNGTVRAAEDQATAALSKARLELDLRARELKGEATQLLRTYQAQQENLRFANERLAAADETVRERALRAVKLPGDVLEKRQQARFEHYKVAIDAVDADAQRLENQARLLVFAPTGCRSERVGTADHTRAASPVPERDTPRSTMLRAEPNRDPAVAGAVANHSAFAPSQAVNPRVASTKGLGVYFWNVRALLAGTSGAQSVLERVAARGIRRVLLSLNREQIDALAGPSGRKRIIALLNRARKRNIQCDLLLGEPTWILPQHRASLLAIIKKLKAIPFGGVHLDLEPNQLDERTLGTEYLLRELLATLAEVKRISPWPVGLSLHPRYLQPAVSDRGFATRLQGLGIDEVTLMVYVTNPERVHAIAAPLLKAYPQLRFSIAQSIEDSLSREESHFSAGRAEFKRRMERLQARFKTPNFNGIVVQAWSYYNSMTP